MPLVLTPFQVFAALSAFCGLVALQFFKGRRVNLVILRKSIDIFEKTLPIADKLYQIVGLYVGYRAVYWLNSSNVSRAEATVLLLPRYSLLYYPISKLTMRFDKLYLTYWFSKPLPYGEAHLVRVGAYRKPLSKVIRNATKMNYSETIVHGVKFHCIYSDSAAMNRLLRFIERIPIPKDVMHIAIVPEKPGDYEAHLYLYTRMRLETLGTIVDASYKLAKSLV